ncbi:hypothetical protein HDV05_008170 [Chytridiales sp. JEL 0842]|nr:hypothetical protein HDV05_008170 [Chytridiales sp. JEL 0842]
MSPVYPNDLDAPTSSQSPASLEDGPGPSQPRHQESPTTQSPKDQKATPVEDPASPSSSRSAVSDMSQSQQFPTNNQTDAEPSLRVPQGPVRNDTDILLFPDSQTLTPDSKKEKERETSSQNAAPCFSSSSAAAAATGVEDLPTYSELDQHLLPPAQGTSSASKPLLGDILRRQQQVPNVVNFSMVPVTVRAPDDDVLTTTNNGGGVRPAQPASVGLPEPPSTQSFLTPKDGVDSMTGVQAEGESKVMGIESPVEEEAAKAKLRRTKKILIISLAVIIAVLVIVLVVILNKGLCLTHVYGARRNEDLIVNQYNPVETQARFNIDAGGYIRTLAGELCMEQVGTSVLQLPCEVGKTSQRWRQANNAFFGI